MLLTQLVVPAAQAHRVEVRRPYPTFDSALWSAFEDADRFEVQELRITPELRARIESRLEKRFPFSGVRVHLALSNAQPIGKAIVTEEVAKQRLMTFLVAFDNEDRVKRIELLAFRDQAGQEVRGRNFLRQYEGRSLGDSFAVGEEIEAIPGAVLSARGISRGTRRMLVFLDVLNRLCTSGDGGDEEVLARAVRGARPWTCTATPPMPEARPVGDHRRQDPLTLVRDPVVVDQPRH